MKSWKKKSIIVLTRQESPIHKINICIGVMVLIEWGGEDYYKHQFSLEDPWKSEKPFQLLGKKVIWRKSEKGEHNKHMKYASTFEIWDSIERVLAWITTTKYHRMGSLNNKHFLQFWVMWWSSRSRCQHSWRDLVEALFLACRQLSSLWLLHANERETAMNLFL